LAIGTCLTGLLLWVGTPIWGCWIAATFTGGVHEQGEKTPDGRYFSDFRSGQPDGGWWLNGVLDVLAFTAGVPIALVIRILL